MQYSGPITYAYVAADSFAWADYIFGKRPQCNRKGGLIAQVYVAADSFY